MSGVHWGLIPHSGYEWAGVRGVRGPAGGRTNESEGMGGCSKRAGGEVGVYAIAQGEHGRAGGLVLFAFATLAPQIPEILEDYNALSREQIAVERAEARAAHAEKVGATPGECDEPLPIERGAGRITATIVDAIGSAESPYPTGVFADRVRAELALRDGVQPGFTRYCDHFRDALRRGVFQADEGAIPASAKFSYYMPCTLSHPGLCAFHDARILQAAKSCSDQIYKLAQEVGRGTFLNVRFQAGGWAVESWALVAHIRGSGPRMVMLACCTLQEEARLLRIDLVNGVHKIIMCVTFVGLFFKEAPPDIDIEVHCAPVIVDDQGLASIAEARLSPDWREQVREKQRRCFPMEPQTRTAVDPAVKRMKAGLRAACTDGRLPKRPAPGVGSGIRVIRPVPPPPEPAVAGRDAPTANQVDHESTDDGSECSGLHRGDDSSSGDDADVGELAPCGDAVVSAASSEPPALPPPPAPQEAPDAAAIIPRLPRGRDGRPWQSWVIGQWGYIVFDSDRDSLGAHCNVCSHGLCRANKICRRYPLGYLVAWLQAGHLPDVQTRQDHVGRQARLCSEMGFAERRRARQWLVDKASAFGELLALEAKHHEAGPVEEPLRIRR